MENIKIKIDLKWSNPAVLRLLYWMYGDDPACASAISDPGYTAGNTAFADDVCEVLNYLERIHARNKKVMED